MPQSRTTGLLLLVVGMLTFSGTTNSLLPAIAFWPAAVVCCFGIVIFVKANRVATQAAEEALRRRVAPPLRNNSRVEGSVEAQTRADGRLLESAAARGGRNAARSAAPQRQAREDEIVLYEVDDAQAITHTNEFVVTTDVSFPLELQQQGALGDQLEKLDRLRDQGILSAEEFAVAKAKLLR